MSAPLKGSCFCTAVTYVVSGAPALSAFCHCTQCQRQFASPFVHAIHVASSAFSWTHSEPHDAQLDTFVIPTKPWKTRYRCKNCGVCVAGRNSQTGNCSIWGATLERTKDGKIKAWDVVKPTAHIFYGTRMVEVNDDLGKWEGFEGKSNRVA
ncbi:hypothetical protein POSPLADRAFT_1143555 [Postia placenta MAD-698-R-SB12]|uniref:CENP-V/GFA domain-containing protein n=1 Tax=Postia placenta MAD-698-R-SB12 TaxID=670580 RepID=A0A1X6N0J1_9APHY|nr:hypothetical protein POSPLADRAFT_1143555 [Postia placenta MAD-698-R-SB12]OSX62128.1 hypothetical protein POSPLADRAFT_1143555 [Postia placenta MAD-698-R-SB12]